MQTRSQETIAEIILASGSPRRSDLLRLSGWEFEAIPARTIERFIPGEEPQQAAVRLALEKAEAMAGQSGRRIILAADTVVVFNSSVLGKPGNSQLARWMLRTLRGQIHEVITAIVLNHSVTNEVVVDTCLTRVPMRNYSDEEMERYLATGSSMDKAGAYGIQDHGFQPVLVEQIEGCFTNVMGLPMCHLQRAAERIGYPFKHELPASCSEYDCGLVDEVMGW